MKMKKLLAVLTIVSACSFATQVLAFVQTDLDRLLKTNDCPKCDLSGAVLTGMDLSKAKLEGANLSGADLTKASLRMADMAGANLSESKLSGAVFEAADLFQANLSGASIEEALFEGAYLADVTMDESQKALLASMGKGAPAPQLQVAEAEEEATRKAIVEDAQAKDATPKSPGLPAESGASTEAPMEAPPVGEIAQEEPSVAEVEEVAITKNVAPSAEIVQQEAPQVEVEPDALPVEVAPEVSPVKGDGVISEKELVPDAAVAQEEELPSGETVELAEASEQKAASAPLPVPGDALQSKSAEVTETAKEVGPISSEALLKRAKKSKVCVECDFSGMTLGSVSMKGFYLERANFAGAQMAGANFKEASLKSAKFSGANLQGASFKGADLYLADFSGANLDGADFRGAAVDGVIFGDATLNGAQLDAAKQ